MVNEPKIAVEIDDDLYKLLMKSADPLEDANAVLRRLLVAQGVLEQTQEEKDRLRWQ